ncbi:restriction endonuclease subunit S [Aeromonas hydrophila]|uniref:restriction endonuclease subunit S n=1 Tax=Aeromonas hydrophila TaxID=644 RepID=UPI002B495CC7|nr:hypothetical protein [Aeromonas hydrophila]
MSKAVATSQQGLVAKYQPYPEYKDSGVIWSGFIPSHWEPIRFKHVFVEKPKTSNIELPAGSISFGRVVFKDEDKLAEETKASYQEVKVGEFLVNPLNLNFDLKSLRTALSEIDVVVSTGYIVLQCYRKLEARYARWLLHEFDVAHMKSLGAGVRQTIGFNDIGNSYFCMPRVEEQHTIAAFLDYETARIDRLIAQQQRLIELLKEKRQAVISHAVTKGLNPNVSGALLNQNTVVFDLRDNSCANEFLFLLLQTNGYRDHLDLHAHGTANQASLNVSDMLDFMIALPPIDEQLNLSESVKMDLRRLEALEKNCNALQLTLQERRTALISAAVTGKIDLRGWTPPAEEVAA